MARIVGFGSSAFPSNQFVEMLGNRDLAVSLINELAGDEILIASRERLNKYDTSAFYVTDQDAENFNSWLGPRTGNAVPDSGHGAGAQEVLRLSPRPASCIPSFSLSCCRLFLDSAERQPEGAIESKQERLLKLDGGVDSITVSSGEEYLKFQKTKDGKHYKVVAPTENLSRKTSWRR